MGVTIKWLAGTASDVTEDAITEINFGDIVRPGTATASFKIGNTGSSIAEQVVVSADGADAEAVSWKSFSSDDSTYSATLNLPNIPATTGLSSTIYVKTTVPETGTTGTHTSNVKVSYVFV